MRPKSSSFPSLAAPGAGLAPLLLVVLALPALTLVAPGPASASDAAPRALDTERVQPDPGDVPGATSFPPTRSAGTASFAGRLRAMQAAHERSLAALRERLAAANRAERGAVQREIEALKLAHQADLVVQQLARARAFGHEAVAARLERRLATLRAPEAAERPTGGAR